MLNDTLPGWANSSAPVEDEHELTNKDNGQKLGRSGNRVKSCALPSSPDDWRAPLLGFPAGEPQPGMVDRPGKHKLAPALGKCRGRIRDYVDLMPTADGFGGGTGACRPDRTIGQLHARQACPVLLP